MPSLPTEFEAEKAEIECLLQQKQLEQKTLLQAQINRTHLRQADVIDKT